MTVSIHIDGNSAADVLAQMAVLLASNTTMLAAPPAKNSTVAAVPTAVENTGSPAAASLPATENSSDDSVVDAGGWPWSPDMHASTKGMTQDGYWRMKVGVKRPDPKPGFPIETGGTGTANAGTAR